jgi:hypothetical protein
MRSLIEDEAKSALDIGPNGMSIDLLRAVYRNPTLDLPVRMRAAALAIAFESPKLAVVAQITENDLATLLDRRIKRFQEMEAGKLVEAKPPSVEVKAPTPSINFRSLNLRRRI